MRVQYYFLLTPQFLSGRSLFFFVPSTSKNLEAQGPSYTECPLPPNFWRLRVPVEVEGPVLLLLSPPVFKREEGGPPTSFGKSWRQRDRGLRGYCILSATREEGQPPKKGVLDRLLPNISRAGTLHLRFLAGGAWRSNVWRLRVQYYFY